MSLPLPSWPPPPPPTPPTLFPPMPRRVVNERRRRLGWRLIAAAVVLLIAVLSTVGRAAVGFFTSIERTRMPGTVTVQCHTGDTWRIGPETARRSQFGSLTMTTGFGPAIDSVSVKIDGRSVPVGPTRGTVETLTVLNTEFTAVASFTCPSAGTATVSIDGPDGLEAAVFPGIGRVLVPLLLTGAGGLVVTVIAVVGIVFVARNRRSLQVA